MSILLISQTAKAGLVLASTQAEQLLGLTDMKTIIRSVAVLGTLACAAFQVQAAEVICGNSALGTRSVTINDAAACTTAGLGNLGDPQLMALTGTTLIDRDNSDNNGGPLSITGEDGFAGTFSVAASAWSYQNLYLYFHFGNVGSSAEYNPDYFVIQLNAEDTSGSWVVNPGNRGALSNVALLGSGQRQVPEPASIALVGLALAGLGLSVRRRRRS
jgi:hypothetical protein